MLTLKNYIHLTLEFCFYFALLISIFQWNAPKYTYYFFLFFSPTLKHIREAAAGQISEGNKRGMGLNTGTGNQSTQLF